MVYARNNKTGVLYTVLETSAIDCTNERDGLRVVIYKKFGGSGKTFVREYNEFLSKFTPELVSDSLEENTDG